MQKILFINLASRMGGAEFSLLHLVLGLDPKRFVPLVLLPEAGPLSRMLTAEGIQVAIVPMPRFKRTGSPLTFRKYWIDYLRALRRISSVIRKEKIRLIHSNTTHAHLFGCVLGQLHGLPAVWHVRDAVSLGFPGLILGILSKKIITPSTYIQNLVSTFTGRYVSKRIHLIFNGIDIDSIARNKFENTSLLKAHGIVPAPDTPIIAMVAHFTPWKRHDDFIRCAHKVLERVPEALFFIAGEDLFGEQDGYTVALERMVSALGLEDPIVILRNVRNIFDLLYHIDVLVHPAGFEPFGRVIIEAMAARVPVIAIENGGPSEIVREGYTGFLVPLGDIQTMAQRVVTLIKDSDLREKMGNNGRKRVEAEFTILRHVNAIMSLYEHCN